jgi:sorting nexin-9/18/33
LGLPPAGPSFYLNVLHPDFNFDAEEATEAVNRFDVHTKAVDTGVQGLRNVFPQIRQARVGEEQSCIALAWNPDPVNRNLEMSKAERLLSYSLLSLISTKPIATLPSAGVNTREDLYFQSDREELDESEEPKKAKGYVNEQGAWCWREGCEGMPLRRARFRPLHDTLQIA